MKKIKLALIIGILSALLSTNVFAGYTTCNGIGVTKRSNIVSLYNGNNASYSASFYRSGKFVLRIYTSNKYYAVGYSGLTYVIVRNNGTSVGCYIQ